VLRFTLAIAAGRLDTLSGRYFHAQCDDVDVVRAEAEAIIAADARRLRISPYGGADPLR
jgi:hypothetical protein